MLVYQLKDVDIEKIIDNCISLIKDKGAKSELNRNVLYHKLLFLIHLIIATCKSSKENRIQLNSAKLQDILGNDYNSMLFTLRNMGIISIQEEYIIGVQCRLIALKDWNIEERELANFKVIEYMAKWNTLTKNKQKDNATDIIKPIFVDGEIHIIKEKPHQLSQTEIDFRSIYEESLSYLRLKVEKNEALKYIDDLFNDRNTHSYHYYTDCIKSFDENKLKIYSVDNQNRIYHYLSSLPKKLKPLFNIKFQLDIANSHPLLFSKYLINTYKIDINTLYIIK